jgi:hypothetical protein
MKQKTRSPKALRPNAGVKKMTQDSFANFEARVGYGTGNQGDASTYRIDYLSRDRQRVEAMYRSSWICGKAVDSVAEDMTKRGIEINSEMDPGQIDELMAQWKTLKIWDAVADTIKWSRLYGGAIAVLLIDGQDFSTPLRIETVGKNQFKGLLVFDRWMVQPDLSDLVTELGADMGLPRYYDLTGGSASGGPSMGLPNTRIHYSRVLRLVGQDLPYFQRIAEMLWGQSVLERLWDRLLAFDSTTQGAAQLVYKAHLRTYKVDGLRDILAAGGPALEGLVKQINFIRTTQSNEGMTLMDKDDEFEAHSYTFGGLDVVLLQFAQQLSGALDIPLTRLFGQAPSGMNATGESDMRNYYDGIEQQQERRLRSGIGLILQVSYQSKFGKPYPPGSDFTFRALWQLSDVEKAGIATSVTGAVTSAVSSGIIGQQTAMKELRQSSRVTGIFSNISDEAIEAAPDDTDAAGELGPGDPFGEGDDDEKKPTRDGDFVEGEHPRNDEGEFTAGGGGSFTKREYTNAEGKHKTSYGLPGQSDSSNYLLVEEEHAPTRAVYEELQKHFADRPERLQSIQSGLRRVSDFQLAAEHRGKGLGQAMYLRALQDGPLVSKPDGDSNYSSDARHVREALLRKGLIEIKKHSDLGVDMMHLKNPTRDGDFVEGDHPRAENGEFTAGGGGSSPSKTAEVFGKVESQPEFTFPPNFDVPYYQAKMVHVQFPELIKSGAAVKTTIPNHSLIATQETLSPAIVDKYRAQSPDKLPEIWAHEGQYYITDGHHRLAAEILQGKKASTVMLYKGAPPAKETADADALKKKLTTDEEWNEGDHPRADNGEFSNAAGGGSGSSNEGEAKKAPTFAEHHEAVTNSLNFNQAMHGSQSRELARKEAKLAETKAAGFVNYVLEDEISDLRKKVDARAEKIKIQQSQQKVFANPKKEKQFVNGPTEIGGYLSEQEEHRNIVAALHRDHPKLAAALEKRGIVKQLTVGRSVFVEPTPQPGQDPEIYKRAIGLAHPESGKIQVRGPEYEGFREKGKKLHEHWTTGSYQTNAEQATYATFVHEAGHQFDFNDLPEPGTQIDDLEHWLGIRFGPGSTYRGGGDRLTELYGKAKQHDRTITRYAATNEREYFAESFTARLMHPKELEKRDPEMYSFMTSWMQKRGIL